MFEELSDEEVKQCSLGKFVDVLGPDAKENLVSALASDRVSSVRIVQSIRHHTGKGFSEKTINAHRVGRCQCSKN